MITFTEAQLSAVVVSFLWPFVRILGLMSTAPPFNESNIPTLVKIGLAAVIALIVSPTLPTLPALTPFSLAGLWILGQQALIGVALGFVMQVIFAAAQTAADYVGLQMGLSFAVLISPGSDGSTDVLSKLFNMIAILAFLAFNGHLTMLAALVDSFQLLPIGGAPLAAAGWHLLAVKGADIFMIGLLLALPLIASLLLANLALGILNRAAPQLNIFAVGFPLTLLTGLLVLELLMPRFAPMFQHMFATGIDLMNQISAALKGT